MWSDLDDAAAAAAAADDDSDDREADAGWRADKHGTCATVCVFLLWEGVKNVHYMSHM